jgi:hypothetical protein
MILTQLSIYKNESYQPNPDGYRGTLSFKNQYGDITLQLTPELSAKILALVGENAIEATRAVANNLTAAVFSQPALAAPVKQEEPEHDDDFGI